MRFVHSHPRLAAGLAALCVVTVFGCADSPATQAPVDVEWAEDVVEPLDTGPGRALPDTHPAADVDSDADTGPLLTPDVAVRDVATEDAPDVAIEDAPELPDGPPEPLLPGCPEPYAAPIITGSVAGDLLVEASGVAASRHQPDVLWLHNDSGDSARVIALNTQAQTLATVKLKGVDAVDFEDIAVADCPGQGAPCVWVGDIGNNGGKREQLAIHLVPEPSLMPDEAPEKLSVEVSTLIYEYPDEPVDAEALLVAADGSAFWVFEKVDADKARIFASTDPLVPDGEPIVLTTVATFATPGFPIPKGKMITGGDLHESGHRLVLRVYTGSFEYILEIPHDLASMASVPPITAALGPLDELQGEAIGYDHLGLGLWTISEDPGGDGDQPLHYYGCGE